MAKQNKEKTVIKSLNIFDVKTLLTTPNKDWKKLTDLEKKPVDGYMLNRLFSMNYYLIELVNSVQKYTTEILEKREIYKLFYGLVPKKPLWDKYIKRNATSPEPKVELLELLSRHYNISLNEAWDYVNIFNKTSAGKLELEGIVQMYGLPDKKIKELLKYEVNSKK